MVETDFHEEEYRGRLAPSPTGLLHLGHARTFRTAWQRAKDRLGTLVLRNDDLDSERCKPQFVAAMFEDLAWCGLDWEEGPDRGGPYGPYNQSERYEYYRDAWRKLAREGWIYPCTCSRKNIMAVVSAPHEGDEELIYPGTCRPSSKHAVWNRKPLENVNWRFRVPDGETVTFVDGCVGERSFVAGRDFGDFVLWRKDGVASYQLASVVDDALMNIGEVVRGCDLLLSTARQILLFRALGWKIPAFYHCPLVKDERGERLAKRSPSWSLKALRESGSSPEILFDADFLKLG
ncbi:MAG: tRNA glutamyl-Q(34) synthetase GluQRS [Opitutales bacterium]